MLDKGKTRFGAVDVVGLAVALLLAGLTFLVVGGASRARRAALEREYEGLTQDLAYLTNVSETVGQGQQTLATLHEYLGQLNARLPATMDFPQFYEALTRHADECRVLIPEIEPGDVSDRDDYLAMPVSVRALASFQDFHRFLYALTTSPRLTTLDFLSVTPSEDGRLCDADLVVNIYALQEPDESDGQ